MPRAPATKALAAHAWGRLFDFFISTRHQRDDTLLRFGLTPNDSKALSTLDGKEGKPMRALAEAWGTDASNATWVVDRLERLGLAERRLIASDRRVKLVVLTARGVRTRDEILKAFHQPPPEIFALGRRDLQALAAILGKVGAPIGARRAGRRPSAGKRR
jgi:DNA-binding MarR family transcriptional regulator